MTERVDSSGTGFTPMECARCGVCCTKHQAIVSPEQVQIIADFLSISVDEWVQQYADTRWQSHKNYLIRHGDSGCIFLEYKKESSSCAIHPARPSCCSEWIPSPDNAECREGLERLKA